MSTRLLISTLAAPLLGATSEGFAADLAVKAPPVLAPPVPSWTGFYFGGNVGYGWSQKEFIDNFSPPLGAEDGSVTATGVVGGLQGGYNYQIDSILVGVEGGFTWSGATGTFSCFPLLAPKHALRVHNGSLTPPADWVSYGTAPSLATCCSTEKAERRGCATTTRTWRSRELHLRLCREFCLAQAKPNQDGLPAPASN